MKLAHLVFLSLAFVSTSIAQKADYTARLKAEAQGMADCLQTENWSKIADATYPGLIKMLGGREQMIKVISQGIAQAKAQGISMKTTVGTPGKATIDGDTHYVLIPQNLVMNMPGRTIRQSGHTLAISKDAGKTWKHLDLSMITESQLASAFPELVGKFPFPAKSKPVITPK